LERGDLYRTHALGDDPRRWRVYVIVSRPALIRSRYSSVVCAPVYSSRDDLATQVFVDEADGMKWPSSIHCDNLMSVLKSDLRHYVGSLSRAKLDDLNRALIAALDLEDSLSADR
jgi:mRNA interferase MazF